MGVRNRERGDRSPMRGLSFLKRRNCVLLLAKASTLYRWRGRGVGVVETVG
jgi:hypothetical protein